MSWEDGEEQATKDWQRLGYGIETGGACDHLFGCGGM